MDKISRYRVYYTEPKAPRATHRAEILRLVRKGYYSRADIARRTGLTRATVTILTDELMSEGLIAEQPSIKMSGLGVKGRTPTPLTLAPDKYIVAGMYLTRTDMAVGITDFGGGTIRQDKVSFTLDEDARSVMDRVCAVLDGYLVDLPNDKLLGIGVGTPGPVDSRSGVIKNPPNLDKWWGFDVRAYLVDRYGTRVIVDDVANALAIGETADKEHDNDNTFSMIVDDSGIGGAVILDGELYRGKARLATYIGHTTVEYRGEKCRCGNVGCAELYVSTRNMSKWSAQMDARYDDWTKIMAGVDRRDISAIRIIEREAEYLSALAVNAINMFGVNQVVFSGRVIECPLLIDMVNNQVRSRVFSKDGEVVVRASAYEYLPAKVGAELVIEDFCRRGGTYD